MATSLLIDGRERGSAKVVVIHPVSGTSNHSAPAGCGTLVRDHAEPPTTPAWLRLHFDNDL
jgi:hypothetical protein